MLPFVNSLFAVIPNPDETKEQRFARYLRHIADKIESGNVVDGELTVSNPETIVVRSNGQTEYKLCFDSWFIFRE